MSYFRKKTYIQMGSGAGGGVAENMKFLNKMWKLKGPRKGIHRGDQENVEFPRVLDRGLGISKGYI